MIQINVYWNGFYQGWFNSPVRLGEKDIITGMLFQNITAGERFEVVDASKLEVVLGVRWPDDKNDIQICQDISVVQLY
jgi:hypothetical protein